MTGGGDEDAPLEGAHGCTPSSGYRQRKAGDTRRAEIVTAVLDLLHEGGVSAVTTTAIAKRIGIAQASLFRHFPTKAAMWEAVLESVGAQVLPYMLEAKNTPGTPLCRLRAMMHTWLRLGEKLPALSALIFSRELFAASDEMRALLAARIQRPHALYCGVIRQAVAVGEVRPDIDVARVGWMLIGQLHGLMIRRTVLDRTFDVHGELDVILDMLVMGLGPVHGGPGDAG